MPSSSYSYRGVYLLHFDPPYSHAGHYLGYAKRNLLDYARAVASGRQWAPHPLVEAAIGQGSTVKVVDWWPGENRAFQRRLRSQGGLSRHCPTCRAAGAFHA